MLSNPTIHGRSHPWIPPFRNSNNCKLLVSSSCSYVSLFRPECCKKGSFLFNLSRNSSSRRRKFSSSALGDGTVQDGSGHYSVEIPFGDRRILVETGHMGRQASGAVTVTDGETIVYTTVCMDDIPSEPSDFVPLSVNYQERFSAAGRTSIGWNFFQRVCLLK